VTGTGPGASPFDPIGDALGRLRAEFLDDDRGTVADYIL
jgi:hypothetical protein